MEEENGRMVTRDCGSWRFYIGETLIKRYKVSIGQ
jgi:hypothetical protein